MTEKVTSAGVSVPPPEFRMDRESTALYTKSQELLAQAISQLGLEMGASVIISGFSREMRRHIDVVALQEMFKGLADSVAEVAQFDEKAS